ncbi:MAG: (d)CMP kinase [Oscillospiraceae bacterium]|nr:(d)CMP kinase [Oscillospiraceae bacterium]MCR4761602.1 (d)CMP kinase [Oscillospiraceae bacterium]
MKTINIAVDGPSGAGKSTLARRIAARLGYIYVDTGALYRAIAYDMLQHHAETEQEIAERLPQLRISIAYEDGVQHVLVNGTDVSGRIRTPEVSMGASRVSAIPAVRQFLFALQQQLARDHSVVMDGRDIGTVVLPDADVKIFLTASPEKRAMRRFLELEEKQPGVQTYDEVLADVIRRDEQDMTREISPLRQAEDAVLVDTSDADLEQSEQMLLDVCKEKLKL